jgi:hypothetical protein
MLLYGFIKIYTQCCYGDKSKKRGITECCCGDIVVGHNKVIKTIKYENIFGYTDAS